VNRTALSHLQVPSLDQEHVITDVN